ncbi:MAG: DUF5682 family protein [Rubripirellula sp.]
MSRVLQPDDVIDAIRGDVRRVLSDDLYWFPVRHHSPAAARHLRDLILARKPKVVLIEGPSEATDLVPFVVERKTKPPIAIYSSYRDDENSLGLQGIASPSEDIPARFASWYPLMEYSPEYVAMKTAARIKAEVVFIDLPHFGLLGQQSSAADNDEEAKTDPRHSREVDRLLTESDFYQSLATSGGFKSWNEAWDSLFEFGEYSADPERFREELATFCAAARLTTPFERIANDGTLERERFMRSSISNSLQNLNAEPQQAMVICGGFHLFMDHEDKLPPPELPSGTVYASVVPYSFYQVSELSGYGAGNRAPRFFQSAWDLGTDTDHLLSHHVVTTLKFARKAGHAVSSADAISVCQHANMLAGLRGRGRAVLDDIHDAIMTCCCKGDPTEDGYYLHSAMDQADIGNKIGSVTDKLGRLPLLNDFYSRLEALNLAEVAGREKQLNVTLDTRQESDQVKSQFFQRLRFMKVPLCALKTTGNDFTSGTIFKEVWALKWSPKVDSALIERNIYGDQVETAALAMLQEAISKDEAHAGRTCERLLQAAQMRLPRMIAQLAESCDTSIELDSRFISLSQAASHLNALRSQLALGEQEAKTVFGLLTRCFQRACFSIPGSANLPIEQHSALINALRALGELVLRDDRDDFDRSLFVQYVDNSAQASKDVFLQGAFLGILAEMRAVSAQQIADRVSSFTDEPPERMMQAGAFLDGVLSVSRTSILLGADHLVKAVNKLIAKANWEEFLTMLPHLRAAFEHLHKRQRNSLAERVASLHDLSEDEDLTDLSTSVAAAATFARIDVEVSKIMESWNL